MTPASPICWACRRAGRSHPEVLPPVDALVPVLRALTLIVAANAAPVLARWILGDRLACPLDGGLQAWDGRALLGPAKTLRGVVAAVIAATAAAWALGIAPSTGLLAGAAAMLADCLSSFVKRRLGMAPSSRAVGLDQIPESLVPALVVAPYLDLGLLDVVAASASFFVLEILISGPLYRLHVRNRPY